MKTTGLNFVEAVQAAKEGKNIRRASWSNGDYAFCKDDCKDDCCVFVYEDGNAVPLKAISRNILATDWEIIAAENPDKGEQMKTAGLNFIEAVQAAQEGQEIRRSFWKEGIWYNPSTGKFKESQYTLYFEDFLACDWEVVIKPPKAVKTMTFTEALMILAADSKKKIRRLKWTKENGIYVYLNDTPDMRKAFLSETGAMSFCGYNPSFRDCSANDWIEVEEK